MFQPLSLFIGLRYFRAKRHNGFISFISFSSTIGIMLGVAVLIIGLSAMNGFETQLKTRLLSVITHAELEMVRDPIPDWQQLLTLAKRDPEVLAGAPYIKRSALLDLGSQFKALQLKGVLPIDESDVSDVAGFVTDGGWQQLLPGEKALILGEAIAKQFSIQVGDHITLLIPRSDGSLKLHTPIRVSFKVAGFLSMGGQPDALMAYVHLKDLQQLLKMGSGVEGISLKVADVMQADRIVREAGRDLPHYLYLKSWYYTQGYLYQDIMMVKSIMYVILMMVVAVACFNIVSTLVMAVKDKRSDIAILMTMGASRKLIQKIFIVQGMINATLGAISGALLGCTVALNLTKMMTFFETILGKKLLSAEIYFIDFIPSELHLMDVAVIVAAAMVMGLISTLYPACSASKTLPAYELGHG